MGQVEFGIIPFIQFEFSSLIFKCINDISFPQLFLQKSSACSKLCLNRCLAVDIPKSRFFWVECLKGDLFLDRNISSCVIASIKTRFFIKSRQ